MERHIILPEELLDNLDFIRILVNTLPRGGFRKLERAVEAASDGICSTVLTVVE